MFFSFIVLLTAYLTDLEPIIVNCDQNGAMTNGVETLNCVIMPINHELCSRRLINCYEVSFTLHTVKLCVDHENFVGNMLHQ